MPQRFPGRSTSTDCPRRREIDGDGLYPARSATVADAVVDAVVLLPDLAVERRCARRLRNAGPWYGLAGRRQIVLNEKMPRSRSAEVRGDVPAVDLGHARRQGPAARPSLPRDGDDCEIYRSGPDKAAIWPASSLRILAMSPLQGRRDRHDPTVSTRQDGGGNRTSRPISSRAVPGDAPTNLSASCPR